VQSVDLMPSVLKLAGLPVPAGVQGQDVFSASGPALAEENFEGNVLRSLRSVQDGSVLKLIEANPGNPRGLRPVEMYRVDRDAREQNDLAAREPAVVERTRTQLRAQQLRAAQGRAAQRSVALDLDATRVERLRALGYAGGDKPH
jgi:arylsulfatase A-like enzyme